MNEYCEWRKQSDMSPRGLVTRDTHLSQLWAHTPHQIHVDEIRLCPEWPQSRALEILPPLHELLELLVSMPRVDLNLQLAEWEDCLGEG